MWPKGRIAADQLDIVSSGLHYLFIHSFDYLGVSGGRVLFSLDHQDTATFCITSHVSAAAQNITANDTKM